MAAAAPLADGLVQRFRRDFAALAGEPERIGIGVSGGADSLALLLLANAAFPGCVRAATVDHALRAESALEAKQVALISDSLGVPHRTLEVEVAAGGEGVQGEARRARYAALVEWAREEGIAAVATAHHVDDQAETILMRLRRGAGTSGLSGIRPAWMANGIRILRPLLRWSRAELAEIVRGAGLEPIQDPSNEDPRFDRVRIRGFLAANPDWDPRRIARSAASLRQADDALAWAAERSWNERVAVEKGGGGKGRMRFDPSGLPPEIVRRVLVRILDRSGRRPPRGEEVKRLAVALAAGKAATLAGMRCQGGAVWRFEPEGRRGASS